MHPKLAGPDSVTTKAQPRPGDKCVQTVVDNSLSGREVYPRDEHGDIGDPVFDEATAPNVASPNSKAGSLSGYAAGTARSPIRG